MFATLPLACPALAWSLFGPSDYEECSVDAAKEAKNNNSLAILLQNCNREFPARKGSDGRYYYMTTFGISIDVESPKLTSKDRQKIDEINKNWEKTETEIRAKEEKAEAERQAAEAERRKKDEQAEAERQLALQKFKADFQARKQDTLTSLKVSDWHFDCNWIGDSCYVENIHVTLLNRSQNSINMMGLGFIISSQDITCSSNLPENLKKSVRIPKQGNAILNFTSFEIRDFPKATSNSHKVKGCITVTSVDIDP